MFIYIEVQTGSLKITYITSPASFHSVWFCKARTAKPRPGSPVCDVLQFTASDSYYIIEEKFLNPGEEYDTVTMIFREDQTSLQFS